MKQTISVVGAGAWGTAIATLLARNGHAVKLWSVEPDVTATISATRINERYLPGIVLDPLIESTSDIQDALCGSRWIFQAIPVAHLRATISKTKDCFSKDQVWVVLSKGIEQQTLMLPTEIIDDVFGYETHKAVLSGPSFAKDLVSKEITAVTLAVSDCQMGTELQQLLTNDYFRPYLSTDIVGVQIGGALKNVITIGVGMLDGAGYTDNAKAYFLTRGLHEMVQVGRALGGKQETIYGLSGVGDLILTALGRHSRNLIFGRALASGKSIETIVNELGHLPEGANTIKSVQTLIKKLNLDLPILRGIYSCVYENKKIDQLVRELMARPVENEC